MSGHLSRATAYALVLPTVQSIPPLRAYLTFRIIGLKKLLYGQQNAVHILRELFQDAGEQHTLDEISQHIAAAEEINR